MQVESRRFLLVCISLKQHSRSQRHGYVRPAHTNTLTHVLGTPACHVAPAGRPQTTRAGHESEIPAALPVTVWSVVCMCVFARACGM